MKGKGKRSFNSKQGNYNKAVKFFKASCSYISLEFAEGL